MLRACVPSGVRVRGERGRPSAALAPRVTSRLPQVLIVQGMFIELSEGNFLGWKQVSKPFSEPGRLTISLCSRLPLCQLGSQLQGFPVSKVRKHRERTPHPHPADSRQHPQLRVGGRRVQSTVGWLI